jgi:hypothetical protein
VLEIQSRQQLQASRVIQQPRDCYAISSLEGSHRRLCLGRKHAIDWTCVQPDAFHMCLRDLDVSSGQELVEGGAYRPSRECRRLHGRRPLCLRRDTGDEQQPRDPSEDPSGVSHPMSPGHNGEAPLKIT